MDMGGHDVGHVWVSIISPHCLHPVLFIPACNNSSGRQHSEPPLTPTPRQGPQEAFCYFWSMMGCNKPILRASLGQHWIFLVPRWVWETERLRQASLPATSGRRLFLFLPVLDEKDLKGLPTSWVLLGDGCHILPIPDSLNLFGISIAPLLPTFEFSPVESWPCLRIRVKCR